MAPSFPFRKRSLVTDDEERGSSPLWRVSTEHYGKSNDEQNLYQVANEFISAEIANYLRIPIPPHAIIRRTRRTRPMFTSMIFGNLDSPPKDCSPDVCVKCLPDLATGITLFDVLVANSDRNEQNILTNTKYNPTSLLVIDHGLALLSVSGAKRLRGISKNSEIGFERDMSGDLWHAFIGKLNTCKFFQKWIHRIETMPAWVIEGICEEAKGLGARKSQITAVKDFLIYRAQGFRDIINKNRTCFSGITDHNWGIVQ